MFSKVAFVLAMMMSAAGAQAGIFGSSTKEPTREELQAEANCTRDHSVAYCTFWASRFRQKIEDVDLPEQLRARVDSDGSLGNAIAAAGNIGIGVSQLTGAAPTVLSKGGMGSLNVLGGLMTLVGGSGDTTLNDKMIAFLPESEAKDPETAERIIEDAFVDAFVRAIPGTTSATYETFTADNRWYISSYVLHGGECEQVKCVLFSGSWGRVCKTEDCPRRSAKARLVRHQYLGEQQVWAPRMDQFVTLVINPKSDNELWGSFMNMQFDIAGIKDKLELMTAVSKNLPEWASYFVGPSMDKKTVPCPMVLKSGNKYLFVKPSARLAAN